MDKNHNKERMPQRKINRRTFLKLAGATAAAALAGGWIASLEWDDSLLFGFWRCMAPIPKDIWKNQIGGDDEKISFMTREHHAVRDFVVQELPREGKPLSPQFIAQALDLPLTRVKNHLDDLEEYMTFLFRNPSGEVVWAYPVTAERTPHRVTFSTGEQIYAA